MSLSQFFLSSGGGGLDGVSQSVLLGISGDEALQELSDAGSGQLSGLNILLLFSSVDDDDSGLVNWNLDVLSESLEMLRLFLC